MVDEEVHRIVEDAHEEVTRLLTEHREQLEALTSALLKAETLDALDAYTAAGVPAHEPEPDERRAGLAPAPAPASTTA